MDKYTNTIIQYEENIFYLKLCLNTIKKSNSISINRELFQQKIKDDLIFIQKCIEILYEHLTNNHKLITKNEQLHSIHSLMQMYNTETELLVAKHLLNKAEFIDILLQNRNYIEKISYTLSKIEMDDNREDLTTNEELNILFMDEGSDNDE